VPKKLDERNAMPFESPDVPLGELLKLVANGKVQLPDFQREWKWDSDRIASLIASVAQGHPVGVVMTLEVGGEGGEASGNGVDGEHEEGGGDYAKGGEGERLEVAESEFDGEVVDGPDGHDEGDGGDEDGTGGAVAVGGIYAHRSDDIFRIIRE